MSNFIFRERKFSKYETDFRYLKERVSYSFYCLGLGSGVYHYVCASAIRLHDHHLHNDFILQQSQKLYFCSREILRQKGKDNFWVYNSTQMSGGAH